MAGLGRFSRGSIAVAVCSIVHVCVSFALSSGLFHALREGTGLENRAYRFFETGASMHEDLLSKGLCFVYAHVFGVALIVGFYVLVLFAFRRFKYEKFIVLAYAACLAICVAVIVAVYPDTVITENDTKYNYVYALEWMPMYWHGFLTNVFYCAVLFAFPNPVFLSIVQAACVLLVFFNLSNRLFPARWGKKRDICIMALAVAFLLMPETQRVLFVVGRNYAYAAPFAWVVGTLLLDYRDKRRLTKARFAALSVVVVILAAWRTEGVILLLLYPFLLYAVYGVKPIMLRRRSTLAAALFLVLLTAVMFLPGVYGSSKYQDGDYAIINLPGPLSAVLLSEGANLSYGQAADDLGEINRSVPLSYIENYGEMASIYYNCDQGRISRQSNSPSGKAFLVAAYRVLSNNVPIWVEYQAKMYLNCLGCTFHLHSNGKGASWSVNESHKEFYDWVHAYYDVGRADIEKAMPARVRAAVSQAAPAVRGALQKLYDATWSVSPFVKLSVTFLALAVSICAAARRRPGYALVGLLLLVILAAIIMTAPSYRPNYYYYVYAGMYWYLLIALPPTVSPLLMRARNMFSKEGSGA